MTSREAALDLKELVIISGINAGFCPSMPELPSSLIITQDGGAESMHKLLTLLSEVRARSAVHMDKNLREI